VVPRIRENMINILSILLGIIFAFPYDTVKPLI